MSELLPTIQQIVAKAIAASSPTDIFIGTVKTAAPLTVTLLALGDPIGGGALITVEGQTFAAGDTLVLLRANAGQRYVVLGKIPSGTVGNG